MIYESEAGLIKETVPRKGKYLFALIFFVFFALGGFIAYLLFFTSKGFEVQPAAGLGGVLFEIKEGEGGATIASNLKEKGIILSARAFNIYLQALGHGKKIRAGEYLFATPVSIIEAESRLVNGDFGLQKVKITFPEGFTSKQVAERLEAQLARFDKNRFLSLASTSEGFLFPQTYFFTQADDEYEIFDTMVSQFATETKSLRLTDTNKKGVVTMASILQKEVQDPADMEIVSGIFWKRLKMKMALQADSTLDYELNKTSAELTAEDLKRDTRYNTYTRRGLPPTPIDNPGLEAIKAALYPKASDYLYFLTGKDGKVYYAKTFEEHKANKAKYL